MKSAALLPRYFLPRRGLTSLRTSPGGQGPDQVRGHTIRLLSSGDPNSDSHRHGPQSMAARGPCTPQHLLLRGPEPPAHLRPDPAEEDGGEAPGRSRSEDEG